MPPPDRLPRPVRWGQTPEGYQATAMAAPDRETRETYLEAARTLRKRADASGVSPARGGDTDLDFPALDALTEKAAALRSVSKAVVTLAAEGQLGQLERDVARLRRGFATGRLKPAGSWTVPAARAELLTKATGYERMAQQVADPAAPVPPFMRDLDDCSFALSRSSVRGGL